MRVASLSLCLLSCQSTIISGFKLPSFSLDKSIVSSIANAHPSAQSIFNDLIHNGKHLASTFKDEPSQDFWHEISKLGHAVVNYTDSLIHNVTAEYGPAIQAEFDKVKHSAEQLVSAARNLSLILQDSEELSKQFDHIGADINLWLNETFPPTDEAPSHDKRAQMFNETLGRIEEEFVKILVEHGVQESDARSKMEAIREPMVIVLTTVGDVAEQHPVLFEILMWTVVAVIIPESFILKPVLRIFGFGPLGPVKGSTAAWLQRTFFGGFVSKGSWFARLDSIAMKALPLKDVFTGIIRSVLAALGLGALVMRC